MPYVIAAPEMMVSAATDLASIGADISVAHTTAAAQTTVVLAATEDEVSTAIAALFSAHGQGFQTLGAQAAAFHEKFVQALNASVGSYAGAEAANVVASETGSIGTLFSSRKPLPMSRRSASCWTTEEFTTGCC